MVIFSRVGGERLGVGLVCTCLMGNVTVLLISWSSFADAIQLLIQSCDIVLTGD